MLEKYSEIVFLEIGKFACIKCGSVFGHSDFDNAFGKCNAFLDEKNIYKNILEKAFPYTLSH